MKVYIATKYYHYACEDILGVFGSAASAVSCAEREASRHGDFERDPDSTHVASWEGETASIYVDEHEVQP